MRILTLFVVLGLSIPAAASTAASDSYSWSAANGRLQTAFPLESPITDQAIRLIGTGQKEASRNGSPPPVIAVSIPNPIESESRPIPSVIDGTVPAGARWPDAHGRISVSPITSGNVRGGERVRNPWEVRSGLEKPEEETLITCGGTLANGLGSSVAFLNGCAFREGDVFGKFHVARILASGVVLQRDGCFVVIPRGSRVTVANAGN
jgi:hypothetical protein